MQHSDLSVSLLQQLVAHLKAANINTPPHLVPAITE